MRDFVESMNDSDKKINNNPKWKLLKSLYDNNYNDLGKSKIPKKIHQIWLGGGLPENYNILKSSIIKSNPGWEYKLWTEDDLDELNMVNKELFNKSTNLGSKSDILRLEILYQYGGIYMDTDFYCIKNFNSLLTLDFFAGTGQQSEVYLLNGLIGCVPHHEIISKSISGLKEKTYKSKSNFEEIMKMTGPYYFTDTFFENVDEKTTNVVVFPTSFFYSFPSTNRTAVRGIFDESTIKKISPYIRDESLCVHLWYTSWQK
jgi:mannosyltransferase OCH1-like enzyme